MKVFELAERLGGMTAYELMERMSLREIQEWVEYDRCHHDPADVHTAMILARMDALAWRKGQPKPDIGRYLTPIKKRKARPRDLAAVRLRLDQGLGRMLPSLAGPKSEGASNGG